MLSKHAARLWSSCHVMALQFAKSPPPLKCTISLCEFAALYVVIGDISAPSSSDCQGLDEKPV